MKYGSRDNEIAARLRIASKSFLQSAEWKELRRFVVAFYGRQCMKCKTTPRKQTQTHVDHIKPRRFHPELALEFSNLQVLCSRCNKAKGNRTADYRTLAEPMEERWTG